MNNFKIIFVTLLSVGVFFLLLSFLIFVIRKSTVSSYTKRKEFGYSATKAPQFKKTGIDIIDKILSLNPEFMSNEIEKTNLAKNNRIDRLTNQPISLAETLKRYPEEQVRLECYYKCLKKFGKSRTDVEFPIQAGSKRLFADVVVFHADSTNPKLSKEHSVMNLSYVFECKKNHPNPTNKDKNGNPETMSSILYNGFKQLQSYMLFCPNLTERTVRLADGVEKTVLSGLGCLTNGSTVKFVKKVQNKDTGNIEFIDVSTPEWYK